MEKARKICWLMGLMLLCGLYCLKLYDIVAISAPHELRETTIAIFAKYFSNGINPYSPQYLLEDEPIATSMYGFVAPLVLAPFVKIFGYLKIFSTLQICELVTLIVEMAGVFFGYMTIRNKTHNSLCSLIGSVFLAACYWRVGGYGGAFPDAWGLTIALYICYLLSGYDEKKHLPLKLALLCFV
jgi:hypothetical protein